MRLNAADHCRLLVGCCVEAVCVTPALCTCTCIVKVECGMRNVECGIGKQSKKFNEILLMKNCFQQNENFWRCKPLFNKQLVHVPPVHM